ncbi:putative uncharacterized protein [Prevotella sp. CAG:592]|nr:putative uncharacterized protein [Prevotella sp. CAG:592]
MYARHQPAHSIPSFRTAQFIRQIHTDQQVFRVFQSFELCLLIAYPAFERLSLYARYTPTNEFAGYFNPFSYGMMICMGTLNSPFQYQTEGVLLHEVQHLIQEEEDFARGGNLSQGRRRYLRMAGEVEARNVCIRHSMSSEQRRSSLRTDTQDVPDAEQIIVFC